MRESLEHEKTMHLVVGLLAGVAPTYEMQTCNGNGREECGQSRLRR